MVDSCGKLVGKYTVRPMDPMAMKKTSKHRPQVNLHYAAWFLFILSRSMIEKNTSRICWSLEVVRGC